MTLPTITRQFTSLGTIACTDDSTSREPEATSVPASTGVLAEPDIAEPDIAEPGLAEPVDLTDDEVAGLFWMREEEQLAHDVYMVLGELWGLRIFENIAASEQSHIAAVTSLLDRYGLDDPAAGNEPGTFTEPAIQALYDEFVADGSESVEAALAVGALNRHQLRRFYRAIMPNVYMGKGLDPTLQQRTVAAWLWSGRQAVVAGRAAAAVHGAKWVDDDSPVELIWRNARSPSGVVTRDDLLLPDEYRRYDGLPVTTPQRTAFDLGRRGRIGTAVARLDALAAATGFKARDVMDLARAHRRTRGLRQLERALDLMDSGAGSPKETWLRLLAIGEGYPRPRTQIPVAGPDGWPLYYLDMGWEDIMLALEYDGGQHWDDPKRVAYDIERAEYVASVGWNVVRVTKGHHPAGVRARLRRAWERSTR